MADQLQPVTSKNLPTPVGPYSPGIITGSLIFVSGQAGRNPATGAVAPDVTAQTELPVDVAEIGAKLLPRGIELAVVPIPPELLVGELI